MVWICLRVFFPRIAHIAIRPMLLRVFFPQITPIANRPCYKSPPCGRANCN